MASPSNLSSILNLNKDALRAVLVRTCAADHASLRSTCRRFCEILDSQEFRQQRSENGYAEVKAVLLTPLELYKKDCGGIVEDQVCRDETDEMFQEEYDDLGFKDPRVGYHRCEARLLVDDIQAGTFSFILLPRDNPRRNIHSVADCVSGDLQSTACLFFDRKGRPRLKSVKEALDQNDKRAFLCIQSFKIDNLGYRMTSLTGAKALRSLLIDTALKDRWSIAVYIPEVETQFNDEDVRMEKKQRYRENVPPPVKRQRIDCVTKEKFEEKEDREWQQRCDELVKQDMRQFFRAGFVQAKETVFDSNCFHVFAVHSFLEAPMLSHQATMQIPIAEKPRTAASPSGNALELRDKMQHFCFERRELVDKIRRSRIQLESPLDSDRCHQIREQIDIVRTRLEATAAQAFSQLECALSLAASLSTIITAVQEGSANRSETAEIVGATEENLEVYLHELQETANAQTLFLRTLLEERVPSLRQEFSEIVRILLVEICSVFREEVEKCERNLQELDERVSSDIGDMIKNFGNDVIASSHCIHTCAANLVPEYAKVLIRLIPEEKKEGAINGLDIYSQTPLMVAAASGQCTTSSVQDRFQTCRALVELGANKNLCDPSGETALGKFRKNDRGISDCYHCFAFAYDRTTNLPAAQKEAAPAMEQLLCPVQGPTAADDAFLESDDDEDSEEGVDDSDLDEDEEDGDDDQSNAEE